MEQFMGSSITYRIAPGRQQGRKLFTLQKLERLCRYMRRPAIAEQSLSHTPNGNVRHDVNGITSVACAWMRGSDPAEDALP